jgi:hypothetical protein
VSAGRGDFESALGCLLASDIVEVDGEMLQLAEKSFARNAKGFALDSAEQLAVEQLEHVEEGKSRDRR